MYQGFPAWAKSPVIGLFPGHPTCVFFHRLSMIERPSFPFRLFSPGSVLSSFPAWQAYP